MVATTVSAAPTTVKEGTKDISSSLLLCDAFEKDLGTVARIEEREASEADEAITAPSQSPSVAPQCTDPLSNARGVYSSVMAPCVISFHRQDKDEGGDVTVSTSKNNFENNRNGNVYYHGTSDVCNTDNAIGEIKEYVTLWPDECVGDFGRCYDLQHHGTILCPSLLRLFEGKLSAAAIRGDEIPDSDYLFPVGTTHVSVDCTVDKDIVIQSYDHASKLQHEVIREEISAKKETTMFVIACVLCSVLIVVYSISELVVKPIVSAITSTRGHSGNNDGGWNFSQDQENIALVSNLQIEGVVPREDEAEEEFAIGDHQDEFHDEHPSTRHRRQEQQDHGTGCDYDSQIPADFDAVPMVPATIIPIDAIPAMIVQDGITYHT